MLTESARRVLAHLSEPRSLKNLTRTLRADSYAPFSADDRFDLVEGEVGQHVKGLLDRGLLTGVGSHSDAKSALRAIADSEDAIDLPKVKADNLAAILESGRDSRLDTGTLLILTKAGLDELTA